MKTPAILAAITLPLLLASCYTTGYPYGGGYAAPAYYAPAHRSVHYDVHQPVHQPVYRSSHYDAPYNGHGRASSRYEDPHHGGTTHGHDAAGHRTDTHGHHVDKHGHEKAPENEHH